VIVDTSWLGWRWCFYVAVPFAVAAMLVLQKTLKLPVIRREVRIDYLGAGLITGGVCALLVWVTLAGQQFDWVSGWTFGLVGLGVGMLGAAVVVELRVPEPVIPVRLFRSRTVTLATAAGLFLGVAMMGATVFLSQYFQLARGESPTVAGLRTMPMILGLALSSVVAGRVVTRTGRWKGFLVAGGAIASVGFLLLATIDAHTSFWLLGLYMALVGIGLGMTMQNLVLAVQNSVAGSQLGAATATVAFFRSLGGAIGVSVLGAVLAHHIAELTARGLAALGVPLSQLGAAGEGIPDVTALPAPIARVVQDAFGESIAHIFVFATPLMLVGLLCMLFIREVPLSNEAGVERESSAADPMQDVEAVDAIDAIDADVFAEVFADGDLSRSGGNVGGWAERPLEQGRSAQAIKV
jgi:MFS family permease